MIATVYLSPLCAVFNRRRPSGALRAALVSISLLLLAPSGAAVAQGFETVDLGRRTRDLYLEAGLVPPTASWPASHAELTGYVEALQVEDLSGPLRARTRSLAGALSATGAVSSRTDPVHISAALTLMPQYYLDQPRGTFAEQSRVESPLGQLELGLGRRTGAYLHAEGALQREWQIDSPTNIPGPVDGNPLRFENNLMREGYVFLPIGPMDLAFGRQDMSLGPGAAGADSLYVTDRVLFLDALRATMRLGPVKMTSVTSTLENGRAVPDVELVTDGPYAFERNTILYNIHYFEYAWRRVRLGLGSQIVAVRALNGFQLGDFFPVFSWHNADITPNNMSLVGDVSVAVAPGVQIWGQYGYDDISGEAFGFGDSEIPTIDAYLGGVRIRRRLPVGGRGERGAGVVGPQAAPAVTLGADAVVGYTHYLWGNFDDDIALARAVYRVEADGPRQSMPLTSPHGPGALWVGAGGSAEWRGLDLGLRYRAVGTKPGMDLYTTPYRSSEAIEAAARRWNHTVTFSATFLLNQLFSGGDIGLSLAPELGWGAEGVRFGLVVTGRFHYSAGARLRS
jgi:hypothetical protein